MATTEAKINITIDAKAVAAYFRENEAKIRSLMIRMRMQPPRDLKQFLYEMAFTFGFVHMRGVGRWHPKQTFVPWYERWDV